MLSSIGSKGVKLYSKKVDQLIQKVCAERPDGLLAEHEVWSIIEDMGFSIAPHSFASTKCDPNEVCQTIKAEKLVAKGVIRGRSDNLLCTHKTDVGALQFNIPNTPDGVSKAMKLFEERFGENSEYKLEGTLFVEQMKMSGDFGTELLVSGYQDPFFGPTVCYGFGGTIVEYLKGVMLPGNAQVFMPSLYEGNSYKKILEELPASKLAEGLVRGTKKHLDHSIVLPTLKNVQEFISKYSQFNEKAKYIVEEIEMNPTVAINKKLWALDGVMRVTERGPRLYYSPKTCGKPLEKIECLTNPKSIVVAGASSKSLTNPGSVILGKAKQAGVKEIYALHPSSDSLLGFPAYKGLKELLEARGGRPVDLLSVGIPAQSAGQLVSEALDINATKAIQVISGGFGETEHGSKMQQLLHDQLFAKKAEVRPVINGPNTVGNICKGGINTVFVDSTRSNADGSGKTNCCLLCQSGAFMISRISDLAPAINPAVAISVGNQLDLSVTDFLEHYIENPDLTTFGLYIEGLADGEGIRLMNLVHRARKLDKTVVIYKAGRTQAGVRAAKGHTAAMAGDFGMFKNLIETAGAIVVDTLDEWNSIVTMSTLYPQIVRMSKNRSMGIGAMTNAGFEKCATADHLMANGTDSLIHLPKWTPETLKSISAIYKKMKIEEVVDVSEVLDVTPMFNDTAYYELMKTVLNDPGCDIGILSAVPETQTLHTLESDLKNPNGLYQLCKKLREEYPHKPLVCVFESGEKYHPLRRELNRIGIPSFMSIDTASRAIVQLIRAANKE